VDAFIYPVCGERNAVRLRTTIFSLLRILVKENLLTLRKDIPEGSIARAMVTLRKSLGRTQSDICKALRVKPSALAQWERNTYKPPPAVLLKLAEMAPESERQWWRDQASERAGIDLKEINTPGANAGPGVVRQIRLLKNEKGAEALKAMAAADVERELELPAEWFPEGGILCAAHVQGAVSSRLIAIIDVSRSDVEALVGRLVAVEAPSGIQVRWLTREDSTYMLLPFQPGQVQRLLRPRGENSIVGLVRWVGEAPPAPAPRKVRP
jgi:transcriptional regulator with XRE-family HTH domain